MRNAFAAGFVAGAYVPRLAGSLCYGFGARKEATGGMSADTHEMEKQAIHETIMANYHEAHVHNDSNLFMRILHPEWRFFRIDSEGKLAIQDRAAYVAQYEAMKRGLDWETEIYSIDVTGDFASVKLRIECSIVRCIDYFNMMKLDGQWWIVHKISHAELK